MPLGLSAFDTSLHGQHSHFTTFPKGIPHLVVIIYLLLLLHINAQGKNSLLSTTNEPGTLFRTFST